ANSPQSPSDVAHGRSEEVASNRQATARASGDWTPAWRWRCSRPGTGRRPPSKSPIARRAQRRLLAARGTTLKRPEGYGTGRPPTEGGPPQRETRPVTGERHLRRRRTFN